MTVKDKLNLIQEERTANEKHVQEWKQGNMKTWYVDYGYIDAEGKEHVDDENAFPFGSNRIDVKAPDIQSALDESKKQLLAKAEKLNWQEVKIWNIGIVEDNIW